MRDEGGGECESEGEREGEGGARARARMGARARASVGPRASVSKGDGAWVRGGASVSGASVGCGSGQLRVNCARAATMRLWPAKNQPVLASRSVRVPECISPEQYGSDSLAQSWKSGLRCGSGSIGEPGHTLGNACGSRMVRGQSLLLPARQAHVAHESSVRHSPPPSMNTTNRERLAAAAAGA